MFVGHAHTELGPPVVSYFKRGQNVRFREISKISASKQFCNVQSFISARKLKGLHSEQLIISHVIV